MPGTDYGWDGAADEYRDRDRDRGSGGRSDGDAHGPEHRDVDRDGRRDERPRLGGGTLTPLSTATRTNTPTVTDTPTTGPSPTATQTRTASSTATVTLTPTTTLTPSISPTATNTPLATSTATITITPTFTATATATPVPAPVIVSGAVGGSTRVFGHAAANLPSGGIEIIAANGNQVIGTGGTNGVGGFFDGANGIGLTRPLVAGEQIFAVDTIDNVTGSVVTVGPQPPTEIPTLDAHGIAALGALLGLALAWRLAVTLRRRA